MKDINKSHFDKNSIIEIECVFKKGNEGKKLQKINLNKIKINIIFQVNFLKQNLETYMHN